MIFLCKKEAANAIATKYAEFFGVDRPDVDLKDGEYYIALSCSLVVVNEKDGQANIFFSANLLAHPIMVLHELQFILKNFENAGLAMSHVVDPINETITFGDNEALEALDAVRRAEAKVLVEEMVQQGMEEKEIKQVQPAIVGLDGKAIDTKPQIIT